MRRPCRCSLLFTCWLVFVTPLRDQERSRPFTVVFYLPELKCYCNFLMNVSGEFTIDQIKISHMWNGGKHPPEVGRKDVIWRQNFFAASARRSIWQMQTKAEQGCYKKNKLAILLMKGEHLTHVIPVTLLDVRECSKVVWLTEHTFERCSVWPIAKLSGRQAGNKEHHVVNSMDFGKKQRSVEVLPTHWTVSYDVTRLISSITLDKALDVVKRKLQERITWKDRYELNLDQLVALLDLCFTSTRREYVPTESHSAIPRS